MNTNDVTYALQHCAIAIVAILKNLHRKLRKKKQQREREGGANDIKEWRLQLHKLGKVSYTEKLESFM